MTDVLTTTEAARLASVAPSTIKRWVDRGALPSTRTLGGHRRVSRLALERFLQARVAGEGEVPPEAREVDAWVNDDQFAIEASLLRSRSRLGAWFRVADAVGEGLVHLGERWAAGRVTIADEHRAADALARALTRVGDAHGTTAPFDAWLPPVAVSQPDCSPAAAHHPAAGGPGLDLWRHQSVRRANF